MQSTALGTLFFPPIVVYTFAGDLPQVNAKPQKARLIRSTMDENKALFLMKNVNSSDIEYNESAVRADSVSFYAEYRRDTQNVSDLYGGDAYPVVWSTKIDGKKAGVILVSDGLGSGSFTHAGLNKRYTEQLGDLKEEEKLYDFLFNLYGADFFKDKEAVDYAIRSFSPCQPDSMYMTPSGEARFDKPFYLRSSQYLASRILCVGVFYKFRKRFVEHFSEQGAWNKDWLDEFRRAIEKYVDGETDDDGNICYNGEVMTAENCHKWLDDDNAPECLRKKIWKLFDIASDPENMKGTYLPCTFASWWFVENEHNVDAAALYLGDSRCYKVDLRDGVKQISVDDVSDNVEHDGAMTVIQTFGFNHNAKSVTHNGKTVKTHDGSIKVTMIKADKPCALFCCSDGVYDTCPVYDERIQGMQQRKPASNIAEFELFREVNDLAFEYNFLTILRKCNSLDDVRNMIARSFYAHAIPGGIDERGARSGVSVFENEAQSGGVKLDDSATFGIQFFSEKQGFPEIITALRGKKTVLDKVWGLFSGESTKGNYCANILDSGDPEVKKNEYIDAEIMNSMGGKEFIDILTRNAMNNYTATKGHCDADNKRLMYGIPNKAPKMAGAISSVLGRHFKYLVNKAIDEYNDIFTDNFDGNAELTDGLKRELLTIKEEFRQVVEKFGGIDLTMDIEEDVDNELQLVNDEIAKTKANKNLDLLVPESKQEMLMSLNARAAELSDMKELRDRVQHLASELDRFIGQERFPFIAKQAEMFKNSGELEASVKEWLNGSNALYIEKTGIWESVIIDDDTMLELCKLVPADMREEGFSVYFGDLIDENSKTRKEIYSRLPNLGELERYKEAKAAVANYNKLLSDDVEEIKLSDNGDYHNVTFDKGRIDPEQ